MTHRQLIDPEECYKAGHYVEDGGLTFWLVFCGLFGLGCVVLIKWAKWK